MEKNYFEVYIVEREGPFDEVFFRCNGGNIRYFSDKKKAVSVYKRWKKRHKDCDDVRMRTILVES